MLRGLVADMTGTSDEKKRPPYLELEERAEQAFDEMCDGRVAGRWSDIKEYLGIAILSAEREGLKDEAERLRKRLEHLRGVVRRQFS